MSGPRRLPPVPRTVPGVDVFTTTQVARLLGVSTRVVCRWADAGALPAVRLPMSKARRVYRADLMAFAAAHGMRLPPEFLAAGPHPTPPDTPPEDET